MKRDIVSVLVVTISICFLSVKGYCGFLDELVSDVLKGETKTEQEEQEAQPTEEDSAVKEDPQIFPIRNIDDSYAILKEAFLGIPLGVGLQDILKWCEQNNVRVTNRTKEQICNHIKQEKIKLKVESLKTKISQALDDISTFDKGFQSSAVELDHEEKKILQDIEEHLQLLKNPSFTYKKETFFLYSAFPEGIVVEEKGVDRICKDERITKNTYMLGIKSSEDSEALNRNRIDIILILFFKGGDQELKSYAAVGGLPAGPETDIQAEQIVKTLNEKYGRFSSLDADRNNDMKRIFFHLLGERGNLLLAFSARPLVWKRNVLFVGRFHVENTRLFLHSSPWLFYFEPHIAKEIIDLHLAALQEYKDNLKLQREEHQEEMKDMF